MKLNIQMVFEVALELSRTGKYQDNGPSLTLQPRVLKQRKVKYLRRDQIDINNFFLFFLFHLFILITLGMKPVFHGVSCTIQDYSKQ